MTTVHDPSNQRVKVWDVEFYRNPACKLMARVYQPEGEMIGAWSALDIFSELE